MDEYLEEKKTTVTGLSSLFKQRQQSQETGSARWVISSMS